MRRHRLLALKKPAPGTTAAATVVASVAAALVGLTAGAAEAGPQRRVGVVVTTAVGVDADESRALSVALGEALAAELPVDVIAGAEVDRRLPPEGVPAECVGDSACRNDLGRRLDADELLLLAVVRVGPRVNVDATWADVASGRTTSRPRVTLEAGATDADARARFAENASRYLPHIRETPEPTPPKIVVVPAPAGADRDSGRRVTLPVVIAGGAAVVAAGAGTVFALAARSRFNALESSGCRETATCAAGDIDGGKNRALAADLLFGAALGAGVTAGVLYFLSGPEGEAEPPPAISVTGGADRVGVSVRGRF